MLPRTGNHSKQQETAAVEQSKVGERHHSLIFNEYRLSRSPKLYKIKGIVYTISGRVYILATYYQGSSF